MFFYEKSRLFSALVKTVCEIVTAEFLTDERLERICHKVLQDRRHCRL